MPKKRIKTKKPKKLKLDKQLFHSHTDLLFEIFQTNKAKCARACGVSVITWDKWVHTPPKWPYWNFVLHHICRTAITATLVKGGITKKHRQAMEQALSKLPKDYNLEDTISEDFFDGIGCRLHLYKLLATGGMWFSDITRAGSSGGYSPRSFHIAAGILGVIKTQEKRDGVKDSFWQLPTPEDYEDGRVKI